MDRRDFFYRLPEALIAQYPAKARDSSRLLYIDANQERIDSQFSQLADYLSPGDLIVLNDTRVIPARLLATKATGGKVEIMLERIVDNTTLLVQLKANKRIKLGTHLLLANTLTFTVAAHQGQFFLLHYTGQEPLLDLFNRLGHMPLPPYIERSDQHSDKARYQTVFARHLGAVAAPTAGLHFTEALLKALDNNGIHHATLTLHTGAGTFKPVRKDDIREHTMHSEYMHLSAALVDKINHTKAGGGRIVAVGTTVARALETAAQSGRLQAFDGETDIFIYPGFKFNIIDLLITNFHLPESTLLMLVCAFGGRSVVMDSYQYAIKKNYRFYSYGDAMLITKHSDSSLL